MKKRLLLKYSFAVIAGILICTGKGSINASDTIESFHKEELSPTRAVMQIISSKTSRMLDAIITGDYDTVTNESRLIAESTGNVLKSFFPESGNVGEWFKETGKDPGKPEDIAAVKKDFEKYLKVVAEASKNIAETAKSQNIVETYKSFDAMLRNACFGCHEAFRAKWPEWPEWMRITGG
ncbi:MAG: cytochrome c [Candidatus Loosdrechtia sp.]|uniref:cytochrome c n=1 Tax=Candidatus Loosdrechtia sp. TaxID=3101272 RepID=UPI003A5DF8F7|nr:MAG: cytochrome c [Candidatus Jettenia sp. AMX2]